MSVTTRLIAAAVLTIALTPAVRAQTAPSQTAPAPTAPVAPKDADPVVARVDNEDIRLSELSEAAKALPQEYRSMPAPVLYPMLLDQAVDRKAVIAMAHKQKLDQDPAVGRQMDRARDQALENALISREVGPQVTEAAIKARYDAEMAGKPGEEEVHARHILVASEDEAKKIIVELKAGGDFAALAKAHSTDPGAAQGGDLGFFKKADMLPEFAAAAFALKPGQITETPVHTQYGWHVIRLEERRAAAPEPFEQARDALRQKMIQDGIQKVLVAARAGVTVQRFNPDGSPEKATDSAEPPPPAKK